MKKTWLSKSLRALGLTTAAVGGIALLAGTASALILTDKSDAQKLRKDIQKQQSKFVACLVKADLKCEGTGDQVNPPECDLSAGTATAPANGKGTFVADIAKCESKVDYTKKSYSSIVTDYDDIGCPGDSVPGGADNPYTDLVAYQNGANASAKDQIDTLAAVLAGAAADPGICGTGTPDEQNDCGVDLAKRVGTYANGLFKCLGLCENDYKDKKGNGGPTDAGNCTLDADGSAPNNAGNVNFNACVDKARVKLEKKGALSAGIVNLLGLIHVALNDANVDLFNENEVCP